MRVLVVDDHEFVRKGISSVLASDHNLTLCGEAVDGQDAIEKAQRLQPDIVVMDVSMPRLNGLDATREIKRLLPSTEVVIVSQHESPEMVRLAAKAGARGYVVKSSLSSDLIDAIGKVGQKDWFADGTHRPANEQILDVQEILQRTASLELALRGSEERFRSAMNNMAEGLYTVDDQDKVTYVNPAAEEMFGWPAGELLGQKMHDLTHYKRPDGTPLPASECPGAQVLQSGIPLRQHTDHFIRKDGTFFPVVFSAAPLKIADKTTGVVVCFRDDSTRREVEEALRQSERIYRAIGESIDFGIWISDAEGRNLYASGSFLNLLGLTQEQFSKFGWLNALDPADVDSTIAAWRESIREGKFFERENRFRRADGAWHHILARGTPICDGNGKVMYWAGINLDIEHRKQSEIALRKSAEETQEVERQLRQLVETLEARISERTRELAQAMKKLRELSGSLLHTQDEERRRVARELHDGIGQDMAAMKMNLARMAREKSKLSEGASRALEENTQLVEEASKQIRTMSHLLHPPLLDEVGIESALRWYAEGFAERSKIKVQMNVAPRFGDQLPRDLALSLFRVVQECLTNIHRHSGSPVAVITIDRTPEEIVLRVEDRGIGISSEKQMGIFSGESSGVGFRGMQERVRQFGGRFEIDSSAAGTKVTAVIPFPATPPDRDAAGPAAEPAGERTGERATVLCIDDDPTGLLTRKLILQSAGYRVIEARSGSEGIAMFQSQRPDAVILDYWMPEMKGTAVAFQMKHIDPTVAIIVLSGVSDLPGEAVGLIDLWLVKGTHRAERLLDSLNSLLEHRPSTT